MAQDGTSTVEQQYIRGMDIDKTVKNIGQIEYTFKSLCTQSSTKADSIRWYQRASFADLTATTPSQIGNVSPLSTFTTIEDSWTRNTSYIRKYAAEGFLSLEDMESADIDVLAQTLLRITRAVIKQVDTRIFKVLVNANSSNNIPAATSATALEPNMVTTSGAWTSAGADPVRDVSQAKLTLWVSGGYEPDGGTLLLTPLSNYYLQAWLIAKGALIPAYSSGLVTNSTITKFLNLNVKVSPNVDADVAVVMKPQTSVTWKTFTDTTARVTEDAGQGSRVRVWELGEAILTDPRSVCIISNTE